MEDIKAFVEQRSIIGFVFDDAQNGYISEDSSSFTCPECNTPPDPACDCGTVWNIYEVVLGGKAKTIARPVETNLIEHKMEAKRG